MKKIKLTQQQVDDLNQLLEHYEGDPNAIIKSHQGILELGGWAPYDSIDTLNVEELHDALKYGYTVEEGKVKLTREQIKALEYLEYEAGFSIEDILRRHDEYPNNWSNKAEPLNGIDYIILKNALHKGFEVEEKLTMDEVIALVRKDNLKKNNKSTEKELKLELDYQLSSLHEAMQDGNIEEIDKIKQRLTEIHSELGLGV